MNRIVLALGLLVASAGLAWGQTPLPFYDAFQTFCEKTDGSRDAVEKAVKQAGGIPHVAKPSEKQFLAMKGNTPSQWDVNVAGHSLTVVASYHERGLIVLPNPTTTCLIMSKANEDRSVAAITDWVGVQPAQDLGALAKIYQYEQQGDHRSAVLMDKQDREAAMKTLKVMAGGRYWTLTVMGGGESASVILLHVLPAPASPAPATNGGHN